MSSHSKSSTARKEMPLEETREAEGGEGQVAEILPWPDLSSAASIPESKKRRKVRLEEKYLYYKDKKIPILQFQKSGYDKLLQLLVKEIQ